MLKLISSKKFFYIITILSIGTGLFFGYLKNKENKIQKFEKIINGKSNVIIIENKGKKLHIPSRLGF